MSYGNKKSINNNYLATKVQPFNVFLFFHPVHTCLRLSSPVCTCLPWFFTFFPLVSFTLLTEDRNGRSNEHGDYCDNKQIEPANFQHRNESAD